MPVSRYGITVVGTVTAHATPHAVPIIPTTISSVVTPIATYYPLLDINGRDIVETPTPTTANETPRPTSTEATTIIVDEDETWEAEYLKAMEEAAEIRKDCMSGKKKAYGDGDGKPVKRCGNICGNL